MSFESVKIIVEPATVENVGIAAYPIREFVTVKVNPGGGGATTFAALTDKTTADIPTINTPLATALGLKAPLASPTFTGIVTAPRIKGKCDGLELECKAGQAITAGQVVYVTGASGTNVIVGLARADAEVTSSKTIGVSESTLALNGIGYVITEGLMTVDLTVASTVAVGDPIWLSGTTAGGMLFGIANKPSYPYHQVYLGVVTRKTGTTKVTEIYVKVQNGFEISELSDVSIVDPMEGQALMRNATKWTNRYLVSADINDATTGPSANTLALRDTIGDLHAVNLYSDGNGASSPLGDGRIYLYDSQVGDYASIRSNSSLFYLYSPATSLGGTVIINPNSSTVNSNLTFQNTTAETYTFPASGGTLLANTGNLAGLTNLSTSRTNLGLGTGNSPTFAGVNIATDVILTSKATRTLRLGAADATTPLSQTLAVQSATGTANVAGANFTIAGSQGTGSGAGGSIVFQTAAAGTAGLTTPNALATALTIDSTKFLGLSGTNAGISHNASDGTNGVAITSAGNMQCIFTANGDGVRFGSGQNISWSSLANPSSSVSDLFLSRDGPSILAQKRGNVSQTSRIYDTYGSSTDYHRLAIATARATATMTGASVTLTGLIPAGAVIVGVTTKVTTAITGATSFSVGTAAAPTRFGTTLPLIIGSTSDNRNWTSGTIECFPTATDIVLTAIGPNFTAGVVYVSVQYMTGQAD